MCGLCNRRSFMRGAGAFAATAMFGSPLMAQAPSADAKLPAREEFVIRNAYLMSMDTDLGDIAGGVIHVKDGAIVAVGADVAAPGARTVDGTGKIVMPGLVDTHWHMWNTLFRSFAGDKPEEGYFPTVARFGQQMTAEDVFQSTRLSAAEAINSGITFVHSCGWPQGLPDSEPADQRPIESLAKNWKAWSADGLLTLGMAWRGQFRAGPLKPEVYQPEFDNARKLGLPITVHVASSSKAVHQIEPLHKANLLGKDVQLIHAISASPAELEMIKESGCAVSV